MNDISLKNDREASVVASEFNHGIASVYTVGTEKKEIKITIERREISFGRVEFIAYENGDKTKKKLGDITIAWIRRLENGTYGSEYHNKIDRCNPLYCYGREKSQEQVNKIYIQDLNSTASETYRGVGSLLMQAAMEYGYSKGCQGRVILDAVRDSHLFYYKLGMRTICRKTDAKIAALPEKFPGQERVYADFGSHIMHMPKEGRDVWKEKIKANPIFQHTLQCINS